MKTIEVTDEQYEEILSIIEKAKPTWEPMGGNWTIRGDGSVVWEGSVKNFAEYGVEYPTEDIAERAAKLFRSYHRYVAYALEHWPDFEPGKDGAVFYIMYDEKQESWKMIEVLSKHNTMLPPGPREEVSHLVNCLNSGKVVF